MARALTHSNTHIHISNTHMHPILHKHSKNIENKLKSNKECHKYLSNPAFARKMPVSEWPLMRQWPSRAIIFLWVSWPMPHPCSSRNGSTVIPHQSWWLCSTAANLCKTLDQGAHVCVSDLVLWSVCQTSLAEYVTLREDDQGHLLGAGKMYW